MGLISEYLQYRRLKRYYKQLLSWEHQMVEAGLPPIPPDFNTKQEGNTMNTKQARYLHRMLDRLVEGERVEPHEIEDLRKSLPELPAQKTLEELTEHVRDAWVGASGNSWSGNSYDTEVTLEGWLYELYDQLKAVTPSHPEFLETEQDYENAPEGTIVAVNGSKIPTVKDDGWPVHMAVMPRRVLRWGKE